MTDEQLSPQDTTKDTTGAAATDAATLKDETAKCACSDAARCCSGCACTKTCSSCGHTSRPAAAPVRQDAWSMFSIGALCGLLFGLLLLMVVALDGGHDSYEDACHPRHRNSHECQMYMYHEMLQSQHMPNWGSPRDNTMHNNMHNNEAYLCDMMGQMGQMSSPPMHSACVLQSPSMSGHMGNSMGGMTDGMTSGAASPQEQGKGSWSSSAPAPAPTQQESAALYTQEKANFDKFLRDETAKFEASIKSVKDPAERELRQRDFQAWLRDRQAEFNTSHSSKG